LPLRRRLRELALREAVGRADLRADFAPAEQLSKQLGKPLSSARSASRSSPRATNPTGTPQDNANWITAAAATAKTWPNLRALCWTYSRSHQVKDHVTLVWKEDSSPQALAAFRKAGLDPYFGRIGWTGS
jgi:hypothetical protein